MSAIPDLTTLTEADREFILRALAGHAAILICATAPGRVINTEEMVQDWLARLRLFANPA